MPPRALSPRPIACASQGAAPAPPEVRARLAALVLAHASWFQAIHFAQCAVGLAAAGVADAAVWEAFMHAAQRKVASFTFEQLACVCEAFAHVGCVLGWRVGRIMRAPT